MDHAIIIYDASGQIWSIMYGVSQTPAGIPYIDLDVPNGAMVSRIDIENKNVILSYEDGREEAVHCDKIGSDFPSSDIEKEITTYNRGDLFLNPDYGVCLKIPKAGYYTTDKYLYCPLEYFGDADAGSVLRGKSFTSKDGVRIEGMVPVGSSEIKSGMVSIDPIRKRLFLSMLSRGYYDAASGVYCSYEELLDAIGLTPDMVRDDCSYLDKKGTAKCIDSEAEDNIVFDETISFSDNVWNLLAEGTNVFHVDGIRIDEDNYSGTILLEIGIMVRDQFLGGTVLIPVTETFSQVVMLPVSGINNYFHTYVNLVITKNKNGEIYIKGIKGDESGEYRLQIKKLARTNAL